MSSSTIFSIAPLTHAALYLSSLNIAPDIHAPARRHAGANLTSTLLDAPGELGELRQIHILVNGDFFWTLWSGSGRWGPRRPTPCRRSPSRHHPSTSGRAGPAGGCGTDSSCRSTSPAGGCGIDNSCRSASPRGGWWSDGPYRSTSTHHRCRGSHRTTRWRDSNSRSPCRLALSRPHGRRRRARPVSLLLDPTLIAIERPHPFVASGLDDVRDPAELSGADRALRTGAGEQQLTSRDA